MMNRAWIIRTAFVGAFLYMPTLFSACLPWQEALEAAATHSFALKQAEAEVQMRLADCWQAGLRINPELSIGADSLGNNGNRFNSWGPAITISQIFELGCKRTARQNAAAAVAYTAMWDAEIIRQDLFHQIMDLCIDIAAGQEKRLLLLTAVENAAMALTCIQEKVKNGKATPIQEKQQMIAWNSAVLAEKKAVSDLDQSKSELMLICGYTSKNMREIDFPICLFEEPGCLETYQKEIGNHPEIAKYRSALFAAGENYQLQKANAIPDIEVTAGVCRDYDRGNSFCFEVTIPLPIFNRNQGNISRSSWETHLMLYQQEEAEQKLLASSASTYDQWLRSYEAVQMLYTDILPATFEIVRIYEGGGEHGKYECLDLLTAQSKHIEAQIQLIDTLSEYHHLKTKLQFFCGFRVGVNERVG